MIQNNIGTKKLNFFDRIFQKKINKIMCGKEYSILQGF